MCICRAFVVDDVKLYATPDSAETREAESYLGRKGICHERLDVSTDEQALAEMIELTGQTTRPTIVIGERVFVGFDEAELNAVVP
jgi:glutaredoxin